MSNLFHDPGPPPFASDGVKVMLATVAYSDLAASYTFSLQKSRQPLTKVGIASSYLLLSGNCHVDDARNVVVQEFLLSDCTDLVFLDADVSWGPESLTKLCCYNCDVVGGVYPFRRDDAQSRFNMPVRMIPGNFEPKGGLLEVEGLPAGFMKISRRVLEYLTKTTTSQYWNRNDRRSKVPILFGRTFEDGNRYGGDIAFCRKCKGAGFEVYAAYEMRLGHAAKSIIWDSLGAGLRRQAGTTLRHVCDELKAGSSDLPLFAEARRFMANPFGALEDVLALCAVMARKVEGPILELGSGLTTIVMAATAPEETIYCIEHDPIWAAHLETMAHQAGTTNIAICTQPIRDGWYDLSDIDLPENFSLALVDGPPRYLASRMPFYEKMAARCETIIVDDADDPGYAEAIKKWAAEQNRRIDFVDTRAALIRKQELEE